MAEEVATGTLSASEGQDQTGGDSPRRIRVLAVIPGDGTGVSMVFVTRQLESLRKVNVESRPFFLNFHTSPRKMRQRWIDLRREIANFNPDLIHAHYGTITAFLCVLAMPNIPLVITFRGSDLNICREVGLLRRYGSFLLSQVSSLRASAVICVSQRLRTRLWWRKSVSIVLPTGVNLDLFQPLPKHEARAQLGYGIDDRIVLFYRGSSPNQTKGLGLVQSGVQIAEQSIGPIRLLILDGKVPPSQIPIFLNASDCVVLASEEEGSPNIVKEALACNLPVVSVDVGDVVERLRDVSPSKIVNREPSQFAAAIAEMLVCGKRSNGRERVASCSEAKIAQSIRALYDSTLLNNLSKAAGARSL
jgi:teichuronic acid biosynthesis glycosyltransferase TuaC